MVHSIIAVDAPPKQHEEIVKQLENAKYPYEGFRKGYNIPLVSEIRLYEIRIMDKVEPKMLKDLNCRNMLESESYENLLKVFKGRSSKLNPFKKLTIKIILFFQKILLRFIGIKKTKIADDVTFKLWDGFLYSYYLGTVPDKKTKNGHDLL